MVVGATAVGTAAFGLGIAGLVIAVLVALLVMGRLRPAWVRRAVSGVERSRARRRVRVQWDEVREGAGLPVGVVLAGKPRWDGHELVVQPKVPLGVTAEDFERCSERLAAGLGAVRLRVSEAGPGAVQVRAMFVDLLASAFETVVPATDAAPRWERVPVGLREDGAVWHWQVGVSTLTAGASGSGKGSLLWGLVIGLGPAVKAGLVRLYGLDLKGGMELAMGRPLFARVAVSPEDATSLLCELAANLQQRALALAGVTRQHTPSVESPQIVVIVDELAALLAYADRKQRERAEAALNVILSQGRAVGYTLMAFVQDPKKETVKSRGLFPASLGLRLRGREEVAMVLGEGARAAGALCDRIPPSMPGTGFIVGEDEAPVRVRAGYVDDAAIKLATERFGALSELSEIPVIESSRHQDGAIAAEGGTPEKGNHHVERPDDAEPAVDVLRTDPDCGRDRSSGEREEGEAAGSGLHGGERADRDHHRRARRQRNRVGRVRAADPADHRDHDAVTDHAADSV